MKKKSIVTFALLSPLFLGYVCSLIGSDFSSTISSSLKVALSVSPSDPFYTGEERIHTGYVPGGSCYENIQMNHVGNIEKVWDNYTGKNVTIAFIDSGLDITSKDFEGKVDPKSAYIYLTNTGIKKDIGPEYVAHDKKRGGYEDHGSSTAGVAAAKMNDYGIVGIAPDANILAIKSDLSIDSVNESIKYAADCGADIINMSIGCYAEPYYDKIAKKWHKVKNVDYIPGYDAYVQEVIDYAYSKGCIMVAAAGNESTETHSLPAACKHVIGVGALYYDSEEYIASFSNSNTLEETRFDDVNVDLVAPGYVVSDGFNSNGSTIVLTQGTSFSSPIVAGAAALWKEKNPNGTVEQFENDLFYSCDMSSPWSEIGGHGILNVSNLLSPLVLGDVEKTINAGQTYQLNVSGIDKSQVSYFSDDEEIATINEQGVVKGLKEGVVKVYATYDGDSKATIITVKPQTVGCGGNIIATSLIINITSIAFISLILIKKRFVK